MLKNNITYLFILIVFTSFSCQKKEGKKNKKEDFIGVKNNESKSIFFKENESSQEFITRIAKGATINHTIIETDNFIVDKKAILFFTEEKSEDELSIDVVGTLLLSERGNSYKKIHIDSYQPEGNKANIETVFFQNLDKDPDKEMVVLCSWEQNIKGLVEGKLFEVFAYDNQIDETNNSLKRIDKVNDYFGIQFEGFREGENIEAKYKNFNTIKNELKKLNN